MKNITLSVDETTLKDARVYAAKRGISVNALVREFLKRIASREDQMRQMRRRIRELRADSISRVGPRTWTRADLHER